ncbi:MAG: helix-turn-helix domain-containing protein [Nitrososphaerales archaeon]
MNQLLTPKQVAQLLQVNYHKVLDMIALGELTAYKVGRGIQDSRKIDSTVPGVCTGGTLREE